MGRRSLGVRKSKTPAKPEKGSRRRRAGVLALIVLGALCIFISTLSIWIRDVALDPDEWANTSAQVRRARTSATSSRSTSSTRLHGERRRGAPRGGPAGAASRWQAPSPRNSAESPTTRSPGLSHGLRVQELLALGQPGGQRPARRSPRGKHRTPTAERRQRGLEPRPDRHRHTGAIGAAARRKRSRAGSSRSRFWSPDQLSGGPEDRQVAEGTLVWPFILGVALWAGLVYLAAG